MYHHLPLMECLVKLISSPLDRIWKRNFVNYSPPERSKPQVSKIFSPSESLIQVNGMFVSSGISRTLVCLIKSVEPLIRSTDYRSSFLIIHRLPSLLLMIFLTVSWNQSLSMELVLIVDSPLSLHQTTLQSLQRSLKSSIRLPLN
jgi:hypothetical protein